MKRLVFILSAVMLGLAGCAGDGDTFLFDGKYYESTTVEESETESETEVLTNPAMCFVYVCGAVVNPGVYELEDGSRVYQAIELAGGMTEDAASAAINLVEPIRDGQQIYVPTQKEVDEGWTNDSASSTLININTATKEQLMTLPGIGETKALSIIAYREQNGDFISIEDIMKVSGIKESAYLNLKNYITTD
ncbi:MAG: helix-hairpin-helix domain-containing protein [Lachnospiraceae bacterium]|nr:helix-hairpin-helix domain-containing protein [Lachnospiraceae bacterium]